MPPKRGPLWRGARWPRTRRWPYCPARHRALPGSAGRRRLPWPGGRMSSRSVICPELPPVAARRNRLLWVAGPGAASLFRSTPIAPEIKQRPCSESRTVKYDARHSFRSVSGDPRAGSGPWFSWRIADWHPGLPAGRRVQADRVVRPRNAATLDIRGDAASRGGVQSTESRGVGNPGAVWHGVTKSAATVGRVRAPAGSRAPGSPPRPHPDRGSRRVPARAPRPARRARLRRWVRCRRPGRSRRAG